jgi:vanillate O-demethylase ferredoxin subunit
LLFDHWIKPIGQIFSIMSSLEIDVVVATTAALTKEITHFRLSRADALPLPAFSAGAHVLVGLGPGMVRAYSLCGDPADTTHYEIAVKREEAGRGGSTALHRLATAGAPLRISAPRNLFALVPDAPHYLLLGGGIGLTPLLAMAHTLHRQQASFTFASFTRTPADLPFAHQLAHAPWAHRTLRHFDDGASLSVPDLLTGLPAGIHVYCCGPDGFMRHMRTVCASLPASQWHQESFGGAESAALSLSLDHATPLEKIGHAAASTELHLSESNRRIALLAGETLLEALRANHIHIDSACEQGICGSCVVRYRDGTPIHRDDCLSEAQRTEYVALCVSACASPTLVLEL